MHQTEQIEKVQGQEANKTDKPGELYFIISLFMLAGAFLIESLKLKGIIQGSSNGPGVIPQIMSLSILFMLCLVCIQYVRNHKESAPIKVVRYLFSTEVITLLVLVTLYALLLELLHFEITSLLFLWVGMFLLERRNLLKKLIISVCTLGFLLLVFNYIFKVVLP